MEKPNYKKTLKACYLGFITQAICANFAPLLFLTFHKDYQIPLGLIALIPVTFFFTQLVVDIFCAKFVDRIGYRVSIVASEAFSALGLISLAFLPEIFPSEKAFTGIIISVILYAIGSGLIEVLCSPIVEACPFENKEKTMSLLHSFYCWGWLGVTLISTLLFTLIGIKNWKIISCMWALIPLYNIYNFAICPIEKLVDDGKGMKILELFKTPLFLRCRYPYDVFRCVRTFHGTMGISICRIGIRIFKNSVRPCRTLPFCRNNGNQPCFLRKIRRKS